MRTIYPFGLMLNYFAYRSNLDDYLSASNLSDFTKITLSYTRVMADSCQLWLQWRQHDFLAMNGWDHIEIYYSCVRYELNLTATEMKALCQRLGIMLVSWYSAIKCIEVNQCNDVTLKSLDDSDTSNHQLLMKEIVEKLCSNLRSRGVVNQGPMRRACSSQHILEWLAYHSCCVYQVSSLALKWVKCRRTSHHFASSLKQAVHKKNDVIHAASLYTLHTVTHCFSRNTLTILLILKALFDGGLAEIVGVTASIFMS
jgi:hypothetical protein